MAIKKVLLFITLILCGCASINKNTVVIDTSPRNGEVNVPSGMYSLKIIFSNKLNPKPWGINFTANQEDIEPSSEPSFSENTFVWPVTLQPNKHYVFELRNEFPTFIDINGNKPEAYQFEFTTGK